MFQPIFWYLSPLPRSRTLRPSCGLLCYQEAHRGAIYYTARGPEPTSERPKAYEMDERDSREGNDGRTDRHTRVHTRGTGQHSRSYIDLPGQAPTRFTHGSSCDATSSPPAHDGESDSTACKMRLRLCHAVVLVVMKGGRCGIPCHRGSRLGAVVAYLFGALLMWRRACGVAAGDGTGASATAGRGGGRIRRLARWFRCPRPEDQLAWPG